MDFGSKEGCRRVGQNYCSWTRCTFITFKILPSLPPLPAFWVVAWMLKSSASGCFKSACSFWFATSAGSINFLIADGLKFSHPLHHLGKGPEVSYLDSIIFGTVLKQRKNTALFWCLIIRCTCIFQCNSFLFFFTRTFLLLQLTALNTCTFYQSLMTSSKW